MTVWAGATAERPVRPVRPDILVFPPIDADRVRLVRGAQTQYHERVTTSGPSGTAGAQVAVAQLTVEGMHCASCVALIEETLTEREGVTAALVDLDSARAVIEYDPSTLDVEQIRAAIAEAGYAASPVS